MYNMEIYCTSLYCIENPYWTGRRRGEKMFTLGPIFGPKKTQSENHSEYFNSVLRTLPKFVLFSNQKVRKYFHL